MNKRFKTILYVISIVVFSYHIIHFIQLWPEIPDKIAIHFTAGTPDNWGSKYFLLGMPIFSILFWFLIDLMVRKPEKLNYVNLTEANKEIQFARMGMVMVLIQHASFLAFTLANEAMLRNAAGMASDYLFSVVLALTAVCVIAPISLLIWAATLKY